MEKLVGLYNKYEKNAFRIAIAIIMLDSFVRGIANLIALMSGG